MGDPKILRDNRDFKAVYSKGKSLGSKYLVFLYRINKCGYNRRAFLASKKVGNAVERNRARRLMKESFRLIAKRKDVLIGDSIAGDTYDMIFVARRNILDVGCGEVEKTMLYLLKKSGVLPAGILSEDGNKHKNKKEI